MPSRQDIQPADIAYVLGDVMLVEVIGDAPFRFRIRLHGSNLVEQAGHDATGKMLDELGDSELRRLACQSWTKVATKCQPLHCRRDCEMDGRVYRYEALILPLSMDGETVNMELIAIIHEEPARFPASSHTPVKDLPEKDV